jgi:hypothetical protein
MPESTFEPRGSGSDPIAANLAWLIDVLWRPDDEHAVLRIVLGSSAHEPEGTVVDAFAILPGRTRPRFLVPVGSRRVASAALRVYNDAQRPTTRVARAILGAAMAIGMAQRIFRDRLFVIASDGVDERTLEQASVVRHLAGVLRVADLQAAILFRRSTPNRKPILQLIDPEGRSIAFVKIGWNELTRTLVRNEGTILHAFAERPPETFVVPTLLDAGAWHDLETLAVSPLPNRFWTGHTEGELPVAATREIATADGCHRTSLASSEYHTLLRGRLERLAEPSASPTAASASDLLDAIVEEAGDIPLSFGRWHGDWAPWNMARVKGALYVWDWERSGGPVPLGFDALHFAFQTAMRTLDRDAGASLSRILPTTVATWVALGFDEATRPVTLALYLLEIFVRYEEANRLGGTIDERLPASVLEAASAAVEALGGADDA